MNLQCREVNFRYSRDSALLFSDLSITFNTGEVTALTGVSGVGKSTLLYMLGLLVLPTSGQILLGGTPMPRHDRKRATIRATQIGFVFQDASLDRHRSILDNVMESRLYSNGATSEDSRRTALALMKRFGVAIRPEAKPLEISGGQAQRVGLCRALLNSPFIVLADEPTGNLDYETTEVVWDALVDYAKKGNIVVVATHDRDLANKADRRIQLC